MRVALKPKPNPEEWHPIFSWLPRRVGDRLVWLETIERRFEYIGWGGRVIQYRELNQC